MDKIEKGKFVEMAYELYEVGEDGKEELMLEMTKEKPERFVYGDEDNMLQPSAKPSAARPQAKVSTSQSPRRTASANIRTDW